MANILSLCDRTGNMVRPWAEAGHECICVDIQHRPGWGMLCDSPPISSEGADVLLWSRIGGFTDFDIVFAAPPCTDLAGSGARWWAQKGKLACFEAVHLVFRCRDICEASGAPWMIENPVGRLSTIWRKPDYTFDPCDYGDPWTKKTCLWTGGGFVMPPKRRVEPTQGSKMHLMAPGKNRPQKRAETPMGFARAVFEANQHGICSEVSE